MTTTIGLVSDVHSGPAALESALEIFAREDVDEIICAGDIAGYFETVAPTVELLVQSGCRAILGNHDQRYLEQAPENSDVRVRDYLGGLPLTLDLTIEGKRVFVVHANPPCDQHGGIRLLDAEGGVREDRSLEWSQKLSDFDRDVLIVGHTHQVYALELGGVFVVNPGSTVFNHSCMILSLPELTVRSFALRESGIVRCWNFSML